MARMDASQAANGVGNVTHSEMEAGEQIAAYMERHGMDLDGFDEERMPSPQAVEQDPNGGRERRGPDGRFLRADEDIPSSVPGDIADDGLTTDELRPNPWQAEQLQPPQHQAPPGVDPSTLPGDPMPAPDEAPLDAQEPQDGAQPDPAPQAPGQPSAAAQLAHAVQTGAIPSEQQIHGAEVELAIQERRLAEALQSPELRRLREEDPGEFSARMVEAEMRSRQLQQARQGIEHTRAYAHEARQVNELLDVIPEWRNPQVAAAEAQTIYTSLRSRGFSERQLAAMTPAQVLRCRSEWVAAGRPNAPTPPETLWDVTTEQDVAAPLFTPQPSAGPRAGAAPASGRIPVPPARRGGSAPQLTPEQVRAQQERIERDMARRRPAPRREPSRAPVDRSFENDDVTLNPFQRRMRGRVGPTGEPLMVNPGTDADMWEAARRITDAGYAD